MPKVTQAHRDARRRQILDAARTVFAEKGFAQASTGDIVAASGLSNGAVYTYFPSKNDLVLAVCEEAIDTVVGDRPPREPGDLLDRVHTIGGGDGLEHQRLGAQLWGEAAVSPQLAERIRASLASTRAKVAGLIRILRAGDDPAGAVGSADTDSDADSDSATADRADVLMALLTGYSLRIAVGDEVNPEAFRRALRILVEAP
jgi:AcrR family transcriptional regulator